MIWCYVYMHGQQGSTCWSPFFPRYRFLYSSSSKVGCISRGNIRSIYSDNGSNFIGAEQELKKAYMEMDDRKIQSFLLEQGGDWIRWHKNPPLASHMGGVWEQQIRSARAILGSLLKTHGECLDDESLLTVMTEVECILNSRPLTVEVLNDPTSLQPFSPVNIVTMKSKVVSPPPGEFSKPDIYIYNRKH